MSNPTLQRPAPESVTAVVRALAEAFGNRFSANATVRAQHAHTLTWGANEPQIGRAHV
mgnify:CR=1 FL=1